jgi:catechol 2,3-dioxygenase-like lactoylglutathione lyase family enzyme
VIDHVGYLVRDLEAGTELVTESFAAEVTRKIDRPQWSLFGYYVGSVEVFTFTDPELLDERLGAHGEGKLDHVAHAIDDIEDEMETLRGLGARFSGPDLRGEVDEPFDLGDALHVWTLPETTQGLGLQLIEYRG